MWIDTHCHLDANEFNGASLAIADAAALAGVSAIVIPAVHPANFASVAALAQQRSDCFYALGIHPLYVPSAKETDLHALRQEVERVMSLPEQTTRFVAIGEIGLDFFVPALRQSPLKEKQEFFYSEQLKIAREFDLPVLLHVRRSQDVILKYLRRIKVIGGIAHAFNGSEQQAQAFIAMNFKLGFGGAMTYTRALQIRRLATNLPLESIVLETDAPDIAPSWLHPAINMPAELPQIGRVLAGLRGMSSEQVAAQTSANAQAVMPRLILGQH
jgi:TatD DNase family protein